MTVAVAIEFPLGRYHATQWGRQPGEGICDWPPAPWRLYRAMYSAWKTRAEVADADRVRALFVRLMQERPVFHVPDSRTAHRRHYYPRDEHRSVGAVKTELTQDPFVVVDRDEGGNCRPLYVEWSIDLVEDDCLLLANICGAIGYLGRSESTCVCTVEQGVPTELPRYSTFRPVTAEGASDGIGIDLLCPLSTAAVDDLVIEPVAMRSKQKLELPPAAEWVNYRASETTRAAPAKPRIDYSRPTRVEAVRFAVASRKVPSITQALTVGEICRSAANSRYKRLRDRAQLSLPEISPVLTGKGVSGEQANLDHQHAHFLPYSYQSAISDPTSPAAETDTIVVFAPGRLDVAALNSVNELRRLWAPEHLKAIPADMFLAVEGAGRVADVAPELVGPATTWIGHTPFVPTRRQKKMEWAAFIADSIRRELSGRPWLAAVADAVDVELLTDDMRHYRRHRFTGHSDVRGSRRAVRVQLHFPESVTGPIVLGRHAHIGLGLFVPAPS